MVAILILPLAAFIAAAEKKKRPTSNDTSTLNSELRPKSANDEAATAAKADEGEDTNKRVCTERAKHIGSGNSELLAPEWTRMQYRVCSEGSAACRQDHGQGNPTSDHNDGNKWQCHQCTYENEASRAVCYLCGKPHAAPIFYNFLPAPYVATVSQYH